MRPSDLRGRNVAIYGFGRDGASVHRFLREHVPTAGLTVLTDDAPSEALLNAAGDDPGLDVVSGDLGDLRRFDVIVRSPGVSIRRGPLAQLSDPERVTTSTELWLAQHRPANVVAVTGTKGKSTTSALLAHLLDGDDVTVGLAGNIGVPVLELARPPHEYDHVVVELSSYQLADLREPLPVGVLLNLYPEHADWHGTLEQYFADKTRIAALSRVLVANAADPEVQRRVSDHPRLRVFDPDGPASSVETSAGPTAAELQDVLDRAGLQGRHNLANLAAALAVVDVLGLDQREALQRTATFEPLPHRLEHVVSGRLTWINDSISTIPETAIQAIEAFPGRDVTLIAGGFDRGQDHGQLAALIAARGLRVVALPDTGERLLSQLREAGHAAAEPADTLSEAIRRAAEITPDGGIVLLSPAAPSYNQFTDFTVRGETFRRLARQEEEAPGAPARPAP